MSMRCVEDNMRMAYMIASRFQPTTMVSRDDLEQLALIGLHKAILSYKEELGFHFSTYACRVMKNEIITELRRFLNDKNLEEVDMEHPDSKLTPDRYVTGDIEYLLNKLEDNEYVVLLMVADGYSQAEISKEIGLSQSQISRIYVRAKSKVQEEVEKNGDTVNF